MNLTDRLIGFHSLRTERRASSVTERVEVDGANVARDFSKARAQNDIDVV